MHSRPVKRRVIAFRFRWPAVLVVGGEANGVIQSSQQSHFDQIFQIQVGHGPKEPPDGVLLTNYHVISGGSSIMAKTPTGAVSFLKSIVAAAETHDGDCRNHQQIGRRLVLAINAVVGAALDNERARSAAKRMALKGHLIDPFSLVSARWALLKAQ